jgi:DNA mismatch repair ATPase MutS
LLNNEDLREEVRTLLRATVDSWRLLQKFSFGRGDADDLLGLARTIQLTEKIKRLLQNATTGSDRPKTADSIRQLLDRLSTEEPNAVAAEIIEAIDEEMLSEQHRLEDSESASVAERAENVLSEAGEESLKGIPKSIRAKLGETKDKDEVRGDVWIMRPRLV